MRRLQSRHLTSRRGRRIASLTTVVVLATVGLVVGDTGAGLASAASSSRHPSLALLDAHTGEVRWSATTSREEGLFYASPGHDIVVAGTGTCDESQGPFALAAFDRAAGRRLWSVPSSSYAFTTIHRNSKPSVATVPVDARGVVITLEDELVARRARSGAIAWRAPVGLEVLGVSDQLVFTADGEGARADTVLARERDTGRVRWEKAGWNASVETVAADNRHVVIAAGDLNRQPHGPISMVVLDARTGDELTRFEVGDPSRFDFSEVALTNDLVVYAEGSSVVARRLTDGSTAWTTTEDVFFPSLNRSRDARTVLAVSNGPRITAFDTATGEVRWKTDHRLPVAVGNEVSVVTKGFPGRTLFGISTRSGAGRWHRVPPIAEPWRENGVFPDLQIAGNLLAVSSTCEDG